MSTSIVSTRALERACNLTCLGARNGTNADVSLAILYPDGREVVHDEGRFIWDPYLDHTLKPPATISRPSP
jgi:hypothetical protein